MQRLPCRHVGRETTADTHFEDADGNPVKETWTFARWDRRVWVAFSQWAATILPNPVKVALADIDSLVLKDAEIHRELAKRDHDELERVKAENRRIIAQTDKENAAERALAQQEKREARLKEPQLKPHIPMEGNYSDISETLTQKALDKASSYLGFQSPELSSLMKSVPGSSYLFFLLLKPNHPDMTEDLAYEILMAVGPSEVERIFTTVQGAAPAKKKDADRSA